MGHASDAFAGADLAEPSGPVEREAAGVLGEDARLDGPDPGVLGRGDERVEEQAADATALGVGVDVDGVFDDAGVDAAVGDAGGGRPAEDLAGVTDCDEPLIGELVGVEPLPGGWLGLEGGVSGGDAGGVDAFDGPLSAVSPVCAMRTALMPV